MNPKYELGSTWLTSEGHQVYIAGHIPSRDLLRGVSFTADEKGQDAFGFWCATTGTAFCGAATNIGNLERLVEPKLTVGTAHIDRGDGENRDLRFGRVNLRKLFTDNAGMETVEKLFSNLGIQVVKINLPGSPAAPSTDSGTNPEELAAETLSALGWRFDGQAWIEPAPGELADMSKWPAPVAGYDILQAALGAAYDQAARGKGKERHANDLPFGEQPICTLNRMQGTPHGATYQVMKKVQESSRLPVPRARHELLGAIVYAAAAWHLLGEQEGSANGVTPE